MPFLTGCILLCLLFALLKTLRILTPHRPVSFVKLSIHYLSSLSILAAFYFITKIFGQPEYMAYYAGLVAALLVIYARYVEPKIIKLQHHKIKLLAEPIESPLKVALLSDLHIGIFTHPRQIRRIIKKLQYQPLDAVLIAGDLTYEPTLRQLKKAFLPFKSLNIPVYAVLGNHDEETPGAKLSTALAIALREANIRVIENEVIAIKGYQIYGAGDLWADKTCFTKLTEKDSAIVLAHHPKTVFRLPADQQSSLVLTGHTHGGQIHIPLLSRTIIKHHFLEGFLKGEYQHLNHRVYVSRGIGTVGVPFRLGMPPTIDLLEIV